MVFERLGKSNSSVSIYAQLAQNMCMGLAEIFATVASLEFAYLAAPRSAQSLLMSLQFCSLGVSSFIGKIYLLMYSTTTANFDFSVSSRNDGMRMRQVRLPSVLQCQSLNKWTFTWYFFVLAALQIPFIVVIYVCDRRFRILKFNPQQIETQQFQAS